MYNELDWAVHVEELNNPIFDQKSYLEGVSQSYLFFVGAKATAE